MSEEQNKGGRPTKYDPKFNDQAYKLCLAGFTDKDLANFLDVSESTINNWKQEYPRFLESINKGKEIADSNVAEKLYQRAIGYQYTETKTENDAGKTKNTQTVKTVIPDPTAQIFWLKNRQPEKWRDAKNIDHTSKGKAIEGYGKDDIKRELEELLSQSDDEK